MRMVWIFRAKIENSSSSALVLHMTSNLIISRRCQEENGKEMSQNVKRTCKACRTIVFFPFKPIVMWRFLRRRRCPCLRTVLTIAIAHTFCASRDTENGNGICLPMEHLKSDGDVA